MLSAPQSTDLVLEAERLVLKPFTTDDSDLAIAILTDPDVVRYVCDVSTKEQALNVLEAETRRGAGGHLGIWSVTQKDTGEKIGTSGPLPLPIKENNTDRDLPAKRNKN